PRESTEVASPIPGTPVVHLAVPDVYSARAGIAYALAPARGISLSLGGRIDGIPQGDLIGGRDNSFRRPGYALYLDPGIALRRGVSPQGPFLATRVGARGFEPPTSWSRTRRANRAALRPEAPKARSRRNLREAARGRAHAAT